MLGQAGDMREGDEGAVMGCKEKRDEGQAERGLVSRGGMALHRKFSAQFWHKFSIAGKVKKLGDFQFLFAELFSWMANLSSFNYFACDEAN